MNFLEILIFDSFRKGIKYHFLVIFWNSPSFSEPLKWVTIQHLAPGLRHRRGHHRLSLWQASVGPKAHRSASEEFLLASQQEISLLQGGMCSKIYTYILDIYVFFFKSIYCTYLFIYLIFYSYLFTYFLIYLCILFTQMISSYTIMCQHLCTHKTRSEQIPRLHKPQASCVQRIFGSQLFGEKWMGQKYMLPYFEE